MDSSACRVRQAGEVLVAASELQVWAAAMLRSIEFFDVYVKGEG
jgi:hypothetical protein